jgi:ABC-type lipoprotein export system ATPase subunit
MFQLRHVIPTPLQAQIRQGSNIWACDLDLPNNGRYFVSAASGKGKTTLQHLLYGLRKDYTGSALWSDMPLSTFSLEQWALLRQHSISAVFQDLRLFLDLSARENLLLKNELTNHLTEVEITQMAQALEVETLLERPCGLLSYGQRQRIAIIRALCQPFHILLMDEPFSHLDSRNIQLACDLISHQAKAQNAGYLLASLGDEYFLPYDKKLLL